MLTIRVTSTLICCYFGELSNSVRDLQGYERFELFEET